MKIKVGNKLMNTEKILARLKKKKLKLIQKYHNF
jgi:hypothetical protein